MISLDQSNQTTKTSTTFFVEVGLWTAAHLDAQRSLRMLDSDPPAWGATFWARVPSPQTGKDDWRVSEATLADCGELLTSRVALELAPVVTEGLDRRVLKTWLADESARPQGLAWMYGPLMADLVLHIDDGPSERVTELIERFASNPKARGLEMRDWAVDRLRTRTSRED